MQLPMQMDPLFLSLSLYRRRKLDESIEVCTELLKKNPYDQVKFLVLCKKAPYLRVVIVVVVMAIVNITSKVDQCLLLMDSRPLGVSKQERLPSKCT